MSNMTAKITEYEERQENYLVNATLIVDGIEIIDVPCKIYLPERIDDKPYMILKPSTHDYKKIMRRKRGGNISLKANIGSKEHIQTTIDTPDIRFPKGNTKYWGDAIYDNTIFGEPQNLQVVNYHRVNEKQGETRITFFISPNKLLTPDITPCRSYTGELNYQRLSSLEFKVENGMKLVFDKHFRYKNSQNGDLIQWSFLVAWADFDISPLDYKQIKNNVLPIIDDFLLLSSYAARKRTACLGWATSNNNITATFYRGNYEFPWNDKNEDPNNELIESKNFERFINTCYPKLLEYKNRLALRHALVSLVPLHSYTLETSFLQLFAGLETLILDFKRMEGKYVVLAEKKQWRKLRLQIEKCIKNSTDPKLENYQKVSMYQKIEELNRVSLREAYDAFCKKYSIYCSDLWPVFGNNNYDNKTMVGLVDIRNRLIHGDTFPHELFPSLVVAKEHLKYLLERICTSVLHWSFAETAVNPIYLRTHLTAITYEQERLSEYIQKHNTDC